MQEFATHTAVVAVVVVKIFLSGFDITNYMKVTVVEREYYDATTALHSIKPCILHVLWLHGLSLHTVVLCGTT